MNNMNVEMSHMNCYNGSISSNEYNASGSGVQWNYPSSLSSSSGVVGGGCPSSANVVQPFEFSSPSSSQSTFTPSAVTPRYEYHIVHDPYESSSLNTGDCIFQPEEIFQLDHPIKSTSSTIHNNPVYFNNNNHIDGTSNLLDLDSRNTKPESYYGNTIQEVHHHTTLDANNFFEQNFIAGERMSIKVEPNVFYPQEKRRRKIPQCPLQQFDGIDYRESGYYETTPTYPEMSNPYLTTNAYTNFGASDNNNHEGNYHY